MPRLRTLLFLFPLVAVAAGAAAGESPVDQLTRAAGEGDLTRLRTLLTSGAPVDGVDSSEEATPLIAAVQFGRDESVRALLAAGAKVDAKEPSNGSTALMWAVRKGQSRRGVTTAPFDAKYGIAERLLAAGADPNARNRWRGTALQWAADSGNARMAARLVAAGAAAEAADDSGLTPLMVAANYEGEGFREIVRLLLEAKAKPNARDETGATALMKAASNHFAPETVSLLLAAGAEVNAADRGGYTALMMASLNARAAIVERLIAAGADLAARSADGKSALDLARDAGFAEVAAILGQAGRRE